MSTELPPLTPAMQSKVDQHMAGAEEVMNAYLNGFERDMNRHAVKHGPMPEDRMVFDLSRLLSRQVVAGDLPINSVCSLLALAIVRGIAKRKQGKA